MIDQSAIAIGPYPGKNILSMLHRASSCMQEKLIIPATTILKLILSVDFSQIVSVEPQQTI
jgi:hypothetical protein